MFTVDGTWSYGAIRLLNGAAEISYVGGRRFPFASLARRKEGWICWFFLCMLCKVLSYRVKISWSQRFAAINRCLGTWAVGCTESRLGDDRANHYLQDKYENSDHTITNYIDIEGYVADVVYAIGQVLVRWRQLPALFLWWKGSWKDLRHDAQARTFTTKTSCKKCHWEFCAYPRLL